MAPKRHILLMGFKHVGKSCIGRELARRMGRPFYELDEWTESHYLRKTGQHKTCRQIVRDVGEDAFRSLESEALAEVLLMPSGIVALGGGTPTLDQNRPLIRNHFSVHITAPMDVVRARAAASGWPQAACFDEIWQQRDPVYRRLAQLTVENSGSIEETTMTLVPHIKSNMV